MATRLPKKLSVAYAKAMMKQIRRMEKIMLGVYKKQIIPILKEYNAEVARVTDSVTANASVTRGISTKLKRLLREAENKIGAELATAYKDIDRLFGTRIATTLSKNFVNAVEVTQKKTITAEVQAAATKKVPAETLKSINLLADKGTKKIITKSIGENVKLIQSVPEQYFQRISKAVYDGLDKGRHISAIAEDLVDIGGMSERKAQFIARDQLGKTYGDLTKKRQENLGIRRFKWLTSHDERVRETHDALDGHIYDWDTGAIGPEVASEVEGLVPGEDYNCRCTSSMVMEDLEALFDEFET